MFAKLCTTSLLLAVPLLVTNAVGASSRPVLTDDIALASELIGAAFNPGRQLEQFRQTPRDGVQPSSPMKQ